MRCSPAMFAFGILGHRLASGSAVADLPAAETPARQWGVSEFYRVLIMSRTWSASLLSMQGWQRFAR